ncbi:MAG: cell division protein FtsZ, partial [Candidatus Saccharimonadales bacterium]
AGGGTGSGAGHIVSRLAKDSGALVVGFATKPFAFEGDKRRRNAEQAIDKLRDSVDTLIIVPNDRLLQTIDRQTPLVEAFKVADDVLRQGVQGISDLITVHGLINLDFADVKTVMVNAGTALMGIGRASGDERAVKAAKQAIESPLLEVSIDGARGILFNVIGGEDLAMHEINTAAEAITAAADPEANIIFGATINPDLIGEIIITVVATGFDASYYAERPKQLSFTEDAKGKKSLVPADEEAAMSGIDTDLEEDESDFVNESQNMPNIWTIDEEESSVSEPNNEEDDATKTDGSGDNDNEDNHEAYISSKLDEDLEKPSFLRRLGRKHKAEEDDDKK